MKTCSYCKETKEDTSFHKNKARYNGYSNVCKICRTHKRKEKRALNRDIGRKEWLKVAYGLSLEDYNKMFIKQDGCCAICKTHQQYLPKRLFVDHCHKTEQIRGLLCSPCNTAIGMLKDSSEIMESAISYLRTPNIRLVKGVE